jgi:methionyl aminopeptidase
MHEAPQIPNYRTKQRGPRLQKGMTLAIEPMINQGGYGVRLLDNLWTAVTADGSLSAHYENTVLVTDGEPEILTRLY